MEDVIKKAYSIHTFIWPFKIDRKKEDSLEFEGWCRKVQKAGWLKASSEVVDEKGKIDKGLFSFQQFLSIPARDIFLNSNNVSRIYRYPSERTKKLKYKIEVKEKVVNEKIITTIYTLPVYEVEMHLYNHGVGMILFKLSNSEYTSIADVCKINDYGRRISLPYIPQKSYLHILTAESIGFLVDEKGDNSSNEATNYITEYRKLIVALHDKDKTKEEKDKIMDILSKPAEFIDAFLNGQIGNPQRIVSKDSQLKIQAVADDRMFTMCVLRDKPLSNRIRYDFGNLEKEAENSNDLYAELYPLLFMDSDTDKGDITCQNSKMRDMLMQQALYTRWSDYGTLQGATNYSMVLFTDSIDTTEINDSVIRPMVVIYPYLVSLVLAQRIGLMLFSEESGRIVEGIDGKKNINKQTVNKLIDLQEKYITFKNQILVIEASCQEQGIELYQLLQKQMLVEREQVVLDEQLEGLYEVSNVNKNDLIEKYGLIFALISITLEVISIAMGFFS